MNIINSDDSGFKLDSYNLDSLEKDIESVCFTKPFLDRLQKEMIKNTKGNILDTIIKLKENDSEDDMSIIYKKPKSYENEYFEESNKSQNSKISSETNSRRSNKNISVETKKIPKENRKIVVSENKNILKSKTSNVEQQIMNEINNFIRKNKNGNSQVRLSKRDNKLTIEFVDSKKKVEDDVTIDDNLLYKYAKELSFNTWLIITMVTIIIILLLILYYKN